MSDATIKCANCFRPKGEHKLANYADGQMVTASALVCPTAVFREPYDGGEDVHVHTDRALFDALKAKDGRREPIAIPVPHDSHLQHVQRVVAVTLSPWLRHHGFCARVLLAGRCDCGLNEALEQYKAPDHAELDGATNEPEPAPAVAKADQ